MRLLTSAVNQLWMSSLAWIFNSFLFCCVSCGRNVTATCIVLNFIQHFLFCFLTVHDVSLIYFSGSTYQLQPKAHILCWILYMFSCFFLTATSWDTIFLNILDVRVKEWCNILKCFLLPHFVFNHLFWFSSLK